MPARAASTLTIGLLAGLSCLLTAYLVPVPIWMVFIAWACYFAVGGGAAGARQTVLMGLAGVVSATLSLLLINALGGSGWATALVVVFGAGVLVAIGYFSAFSFTPAGFLGFAGLVGVIGATGTGIADPPSAGHPIVLTLVAIVLGVAFGHLSERISGLITAAPAASPPTEAR